MSMPAVGPNENVYVVWANFPNITHGSYQLTNSTDGGNSWSKNIISGPNILAPPVGPLSSSIVEIITLPWLAIAPDQSIILTYTDCFTVNDNAYKVKCVRSTDNGASWNNIFYSSSDNSWQYFGNLSVDQSGRISIGYDSCANPTDVSPRQFPFIATSDDYGVTWSKEPTNAIYDRYGSYSWPPPQGLGWGDEYMGIASANHQVFTLWTNYTSYNNGYDTSFATPFFISLLNSSYSYNTGWQMLSIPVTIYDPLYTNPIYPPGPYGDPQVYRDSIYTDIYPEYNLLPGTGGYWVKLDALHLSYNFRGVPSYVQNIPVTQGWNLIGMIMNPLQASSITTSPPGIVSSSYFGYNSSYYETTSLQPGYGYWVKVSSPGTLTLSAASSNNNSPPITTRQPPCAPGAPPAPTLASPSSGSSGMSLTPTLSWHTSNGATSYHLQIATDSLFNSIVYDQGNITSTSQQVSGLSYSNLYFWHVNATDSVTGCWSDIWWFTTTTAPPPPRCNNQSIASLDEFAVSDSNGNKQHMFTANASKTITLGFNDFELPPESKDGIFNVRFQSGNFIQRLYPDSGLTAIPIKMKFVKFPIKIHWDLKSENVTRYWLVNPQNIQQRIELLGKDSITLTSINNGSLGLIAQPDRVACPPASVTEKLDVKDNSLKPSEYSLGQNYPNPFNPTTQISYGLPADAHVTLKIYNVLGQDVATLVDANQTVGFKSASFDANKFSSGIYFYKIVAGNYTSVKKMVLLK